ncbi:MAG: hypothetical protein KDB88_08025, partial [Flavobacteriales bacterium]|nr:hypothetical protein [Flavobacteriales bacterium]
MKWFDERAAFRTWYVIAMIDFLAAATIGVLLRSMYLVELPFIQFRPWLHGHAHTALLGWLFIGTAVILIHDGGQGRLSRRTSALLWIIQMAVLVMAISFPMQGYGALSIGASLIHVLCSCALLAMVWKASAGWPVSGSRALLRTAI